MNITYNRSYDSARVVTVDTLSDMVISYYCVLQAVDSDSGASASTGFTVTLPSSSDANSFIQFSSLTKDNFDAWTDSVGASQLADATAVVDNEMYKILNNPVVKPLPF
jgi:hypothetical protein